MRFRILGGSYVTAIIRGRSGAAVFVSLVPAQPTTGKGANRDELAGKTDKPLGDRLRSLRNQLSDTPTAGS